MAKNRQRKLLRPEQDSSVAKSNHAISRRAAGGLALLLATTGYAGFHVGKHNGSSLSTKGRVASGPADGPWGSLREYPISIWAPEDRITKELVEPPPTTWSFPNQSRSQVHATLGSRVTEQERSSFGEKSQGRETSGGYELRPDEGWLQRLSPNSRRLIYQFVNQFGANLKSYAHIMPEGWETIWREVFNLSPSTIELARSLTFPHADRTWLCDRILLLHQTPSAERIRMVQALTYRASLRLSVRCSSDSIDRVRRYWRCDRQAARFLSVDGETDAMHLLPEFAKVRLYQFPTVRASDERVDCFYSAANFLNSSPDQGFLEENYFKQALDTKYRRVPSPGYGDMILMAKRVGNSIDAIHAAAYVANDIVFTKNGGAVTQPWMLSRISDMEAEYSFSGPVETAYFRAIQS